MTIIVEDGSIVTNANSYVSAADLSAYATARGITISGNSDVLLIKAMDYIDSQNFKGAKWTRDQPLQWPRVDVWVDGFILDASSIPQLLKNAQMEAALSIDAEVDPLADIPRLESSVTVGPISVSYEKGGNSVTISQKISAQLKKLLAGNAMSFEVMRG
jgi:hypothetical protein